MQSDTRFRSKCEVLEFTELLTPPFQETIVLLAQKSRSPVLDRAILPIACADIVYQAIEESPVDALERPFAIACCNIRPRNALV